MQYDIFISYKRRGTSKGTAPHLYDFLIKKGYSVFFDRKEMNSGDFNRQLYEHIENAKDIIILLDELSLGACFSGIDLYENDYFCKEIIHALEVTNRYETGNPKKLNVVPLLLDGYKMPNIGELPQPLKDLPKQNGLDLDTSDLDSFYDKYFVKEKGKHFRSKPVNMAMARQQQSNGRVVGNFLFFSDGANCDLYEFGEFVATLNKDHDEEHPFVYPVYLAGEHRFRLKNNDTCEEISIKKTLQPESQEWIPVTWSKKVRLWDLKEENVQDEENRDTLYFWGHELFFGTTTNDPRIDLAKKCLEKAYLKKSKDAGSLLRSAYITLLERNVSRDCVIEWIKIASKAGNNEAMYSIGALYEAGGKGLEKNIPKAIEYYQKGAKHGEPRSQFRLGKMYLEGTLLEKNEAKAFTLFQKCAGKMNGEAQLMLSIMYEKGQGVDKDEKEALIWLHKADRSGYVAATDRIKEIMSSDTEKKDMLSEVYCTLAQSELDSDSAIKWYSESAELGNAEAMYQLGKMKFDVDAQVKWYALAAEKKHVKAINEIIHICERGYTDELSSEKYIEILRYAAEDPDLDNNTAKYYLGLKYLWGNDEYNIVKDKEKAFILLSDASNSSNGKEIENRSFTLLTLCYAFGWGTKRSLFKSFKCFWVCIRKLLLLRAVFELIEYLVENGLYKFAPVTNFLQKHSKITRFVTKFVSKYSGRISRKIGDANMNKLVDFLDRNSDQQ